MAIKRKAVYPVIGILLLAGVFGFIQIARTTNETEIVEEGVVAFKKGDYNTAVSLLEPYANKGNKLARSTLGIIYAFGQGVPRDRQKAKNLLSDSTNGRASDFYLWLGESFVKGDGVQQDSEEAAAWYMIAAQAGHEHAKKLIEVNRSRKSGGP